MQLKEVNFPAAILYFIWSKRMCLRKKIYSLILQSKASKLFVNEWYKKSFILHSFKTLADNPMALKTLIKPPLISHIDKSC